MHPASPRLSESKYDTCWQLQAVKRGQISSLLALSYQRVNKMHSDSLAQDMKIDSISFVAVRVHLIDSLIAWGYQGGDFSPFNSLGLSECIIFAL